MLTEGIELQGTQNTPLKITHFLHPQHPLTLENGAPYKCNGCQKESQGGSRYCCRACNFDLDWACAMSNSSSSVPGVITQHFLHPQHTLMLQSGSSYRCNACGKISPGGSRYHCLACDFDLDCACALSSHHHLHSSPIAPPLQVNYGQAPPLQFNYGQAPNPSTTTPVGYYNMPVYAGGHSCLQYQNQSSSSTTAGRGSGLGMTMVTNILAGLAEEVIMTLLFNDIQN